MRGNLKLVVTGDTAPEMFDVENDPGEMRTIAAEHPKVAKDLREQIDAWLATEADASKAESARPPRPRPNRRQNGRLQPDAG